MVSTRYISIPNVVIHEATRCIPKNDDVVLKMSTTNESQILNFYSGAVPKSLL